MHRGDRMNWKALAGALLLVTIFWVAAVSYAYTQIQVPRREPTSPRARLCAGPDECYIQVYPAYPTANDSLWMWGYYVKGQVAYNETFIGRYFGELREPLHPYVRDTIKNPYYLIVFPKEEWDSVPIEETQPSLGYTFSVYRYNETYYAFYKAKLDDMFIDALTPDMLWAIQNSRSIGTAAGISGCFLAGCWITIGVCYIKKGTSTKYYGRLKT
jgi:hypothetical protein